MSCPRRLYRSCIIAVGVTLSATLLCVAEVRAQQSPPIASAQTENGINLYKQGKYREAIEALRLAVKQRKDDLSAWHYLGLAFSREGKTDDARKAHEKSAKFGEQLLEALIESTVYEDIAARVSQYKSLLDEAADSADQFLALTPKLSTSKLEEWNGRADWLRDYAQLSSAGDGDTAAIKVYKPSEVTTKARILARFEPGYTEEARSHRISGRIIVRAVLAFDGKVRAIRVVRGLGYGLNLMAIKATRRIRFEPALMGSQPVSQSVQIEYGFSIY